MEYEVRKAPLLRAGAFVMGKGDRMNLYNTSHCMDKTAAEAIQKADRSGYRDKACHGVYQHGSPAGKDGRIQDRGTDSPHGYADGEGI